MRFYNAHKAVPENAKKVIPAGRLKGFTDISPMWRIKALTELFGPIGLGWDYIIADKRLETTSTGEVVAFVDIALSYKETPESDWSAPVLGSGGAMFVSKESKGLYVNDECFKSAITDALGSACKTLGIGADVYWDRDATKYGAFGKRSEEALSLIEELFTYGKPNDINAFAVKNKGRMVADLTDDELVQLAQYLRAKKAEGGSE